MRVISSLPSAAYGSGEHEEAAGAERLRATIEMLETVDRGVLGPLSVEERTRLLTAAGDVFEPDIVQRRRWGKAVRKRERAESSAATKRFVPKPGSSPA